MLRDSYIWHLWSSHFLVLSLTFRRSLKQSLWPWWACALLSFMWVGSSWLSQLWLFEQLCKHMRLCAMVLNSGWPEAGQLACGQRDTALLPPLSSSYICWPSYLIHLSNPILPHLPAKPLCHLVPHSVCLSILHLSIHSFTYVSIHPFFYPNFNPFFFPLILLLLSNKHALFTRSASGRNLGSVTSVLGRSS